MRRVYSLRKCRMILHQSFSWFKRHEPHLSSEVCTKWQRELRALEQAIFSNEREQASKLAKEIEVLAHQHFRKPLWRQGVDLIVAILIALLIATVVRQTWFELYEIPTGSMRPSFREKDGLTVTKTTFGINIPLKTDHFYFDPDLVKRGKVFIFSGDGIPTIDDTTWYFGVLPYTKRYIKRLIGKPGDTLYFYGGKIYGIDKEGRFLTELLEDPWMKKLEHIPFLNFEGTISTPKNQMILFEHMGQPIAKLTYNRIGAFQGAVLREGEWKKAELSSFDQFWGISNYAMARLLNRNELKAWTPFRAEDVGEAELYLELRHSPNLLYPPPRLYKEGHGLGIQLPTFESVIPLKPEHIQSIKEHLYTSRFVIENGKARRYSAEGTEFVAGNPRFTGIPDGTYEFFDGKPEQVGVGGWTSALAKEHPLYNLTTEQVKDFFNMGIEMLNFYEPSAFFQRYYPHRYAYYREGSLYLLGAPVLPKEDATLQQFIASEKKRAQEATLDQPYTPFLDAGSPMKEGQIDLAFLKAHGLKIPEKSYLALGDNHAMSLDGRVFGFVPEANIQGAPSWVLWPPGERWGPPPQTPYPFFSVPRSIVWGIALSLFFAWYLLQRRRLSRRLFID